jgi:hypothetical protein
MHARSMQHPTYAVREVAEHSKARVAVATAVDAITKGSH